MQINFGNTEVAFKSKSNSDLKSVRMLFKMLGKNSLVHFGKWFTNVAFAIHLPVKGIIKKTGFVSKSVKMLWPIDH